MYGTIIGDLAGSIYEYEQTKGVHEVKVNKLIEDNSFYSDDTILTIAVLDSVINNINYEDMLKHYYKKYKDYKPDFSPYFKDAFSPSFAQWSEGKKEGNSTGNGALMRLSPIPSLFDNKLEMMVNADICTRTSHNSKEAVDNSMILANIIYMLRQGYSKNEVYEWLQLDYINYKPFTKFNTTCSETLPNCIYAAFNADSFEEAIRNVISYGGDTDTNAAIVGSIAEAAYNIPEKYIDEASKKIPTSMNKILRKGYDKIR